MAKVTCSWLNVFLRIDLLEVPYDDLLLFLEVGFWPSIAGLLLGVGFGLGLGLGREVHVKVGILGNARTKRGLENFGVAKGWRMREVGMLE